MNFGNFTHRRRSRPSQDGYILLWILLMMFFMSMALMSSATSVVQELRRDREEEMIHRGVQYARAIKKYMLKFGRYPGTLEQLENMNNIRFLRQRYKDPMSPTGEWHLVRYGEVQGLGQGGAAGLGGPAGVPSGIGQPAGQPSTGITGPDGNSGQSSQSAFSGQNNQSAFSGPATSGSNSPQQFGGGAILGVSSTSTKEGIHEFNGKNHYNQWQFIYDPTVNRPGGGLITGPYQPLKQLMPGMQMPGQQPQPRTPSTMGTPITP